MCVWKERSESLNVIEDRERERDGWNLRYGDWKEREGGEREEECFLFDDEKKLERIFALAGRAEEKGKEAQGEGVGRQRTSFPFWLAACYCGHSNWEKNTRWVGEFTVSFSLLLAGSV
jgi:hypothetical protein